MKIDMKRSDNLVGPKKIKVLKKPIPEYKGED
jgi:hypothetical protein